MIKIENTRVVGLEPTIRGMRNPMNSWAKSDSYYQTTTDGIDEYVAGDADLDLMHRLASGGSDDRKFMRMIAVYLDITAPTFWWSEFDTYKVGTVRNSCSKMHKIHVKPFTYDDFTHEGIEEVSKDRPELKACFLKYIDFCEWLRETFNRTQEKRYWRALIEALPEGFNMKATVMLNYEVLRNQYSARLHHKLDEWHDYCHWIESLPYSELITGDRDEK